MLAHLVAGVVLGGVAVGGHGLTFVTDDDERAPIADLPEVPQRVVVLVHGLDDPGWMWRDVIPALREAGHQVARFEYPNDGPLAEAADFLSITLTELREAGVERVDVVSHSMGGLVARDVLTRPAYYGGDGRGGDRYPAIDRLIMCGPPNHGSRWARFRGVSEIGEHVSRAIGGEERWLDTAADGRGEAGEDLLPGSTYLRRLNERPLAAHTRYTIVAGRVSPVGEDDLRTYVDRLQRFARSEKAPKWLRRWAADPGADFGAALVMEVIDKLGDGLVSVESAELEGVDDLVVIEADHVGMIVTTMGRDGPAPAIPVILDRLGEPAGERSPRNP